MQSSCSWALSVAFHHSLSSFSFVHMFFKVRILLTYVAYWTPFDYKSICFAVQIFFGQWNFYQLLLHQRSTMHLLRLPKEFLMQKVDEDRMLSFRAWTAAWSEPEGLGSHVGAVPGRHGLKHHLWFSPKDGTDREGVCFWISININYYKIIHFKN